MLIACQTFSGHAKVITIDNKGDVPCPFFRKASWESINMKLFKVVMIVSFAVASSFSAQGATISRVVLSNMGSNGLTDTTGSFADTITAAAPIASGFITGSVAQKLDSISLVVDTQALTSKTVSLYSDNGGFPGTFINASTPTAVTSKNVYMFSFVNQTLAANTKFWVLPDAGLAWYRTSPTTSPAEQNGSGFVHAGDLTSANSGESWTTNTRKHAISIFSSDDVGPPPPPDVIPEPALTTMLCFGGIALIRRRLKK